MITIYTSSQCGFCKKQKDWMNEMDITFIEKDISNQSFRDELIDKKVTGVPHTELTIDGKTHSHTGFNNELKSLLLESTRA